jgi:hypothetical protein
MILPNRIFIFLTIFTFVSFSFSQTSEQFIGADDDFFYIYKNNTIEVYAHDNALSKTVIIDTTSVRFNYDFNQSFIQDDFFVFTNAGKSLNLVSIGGGMVYRSSNDTLKRIDNSFNHKMSFYSDVFVRNDTIFKFGGYGYWSNRDFFTYFSETTKEWEYYPVNSALTPPGLKGFVSTKCEDDYYIAHGYILNVNKGYAEIKNNEIWKFDFSNKKWTNLGISNTPFPTNFLSLSKGKVLTLDSKNVYVVDFIENKYTTHQPINTSFGIYGKNVFAVDDTIFNVRENMVLKGHYLNHITNPVKADKKSIYYNTDTLFYGLYNAAFLSILFILGIILFLQFKRNQMPRISELGLRYKGVSYYLDKNEKEILQTILHRNEVPSQKIYDIVENTSLSFPQNNKIKNDTIKRLNKKLKTILGIDDFVSSKKLPEDQRVLVYFTEHQKRFAK